MEAWLGELRPYPGEGNASTGWRLAKSAWRLLRRDRTIATLTVLLTAVVVTPLVGGIFLRGTGLGLVDGHFGIQLLSGALVTGGLTFLAFAVATAADAALDGLPMDLGEALEDARECLGAIAGWALISLAVWLGSRTAAAANDSPWLVAVIQLPWGVATMFVIPAMAIERLGPGAALGESLRQFRLLWRQTLGGLIGLAVFTALAAIPAGAMLSHAAATKNGGHGVDYPLVIGAVILLGVVIACSLATREAFAVILLRESLDDLPGTEYRGRRLRRRAKVARVAGAAVLVVLALVALSAVTRDDHEVLQASNAPGADYTTVVPDPGSVELETGSAVFYGNTEIGVVLGSESDGSNLRVTFHVDPGYGPSQTPGSFVLVDAGARCPCLVLVPRGNPGGSDYYRSS
jgi:uncharacterized protein DUF6159